MAYVTLPDKVANDTITIGNWTQIVLNFEATGVALTGVVGDLAVGSAVKEVAILGIGADGTTLVPDSLGPATGMRWQIQPACHLRESNTIAMGVGPWAALTFDTVTQDEMPPMYNGANPERLTIPAGGTGWYTFHGNAYATRAGTVTWHLRIQRDDGTEIAAAMGHSAADARINLGMSYYMTAGQWVELQYQTGDAACTIAANATFAAVWQRP